jgi:[ribosomal protein S5]-alanine N-acetyltransferase
MNQSGFALPENIDGDRISLVPIGLEYLDDFHHYSSFEELYEYFEFDKFRSRAESEAYLKKLERRCQSAAKAYWLIKENAKSKVIGSIGLTDIDPQRGSAELGYGLSPEYWGNGYFSEAARLIERLLFEERAFHRLMARTHYQNRASINGLTRLGFSKEGVLRDYYKMSDGQFADAVLMAKINDRSSQ